MKGVVKFTRGVGNVGIRDVPEPSIRPGHVIIGVEAAGICGTDLHIYADEYGYLPPVVLGHEFSGRIVEAAPDVIDVRVGQRVTSIPFFSTCGKCDYCRSGLWNLCPERKSAGTFVNGGFAPRVLMPERCIRVLPEKVDFLGGALTEPLACCVHALMERAVLRPGRPRGRHRAGEHRSCSAARWPWACGATVVLLGASGDGARMEMAAGLGIRHAVNVETQPAGEIVKGLTGGRGADVVVECSGAQAGVKLGYELIRRRGQFVQVGLFGRPVEIDMDLAVLREVEIRTSFSHTPKAWDYALKLMEEGRVQTRPLATDILPLDQWEEGFSRFRRKKGIKVVLQP